jgi:putative ABC transport system permease protein
VGLRLAAARLLATPLFTIFAVVSLAAGVAVTTAVYSVIDTLFLQEIEVRNPEQVAVVTSTSGGGPTFMSEPDFRDVREQQTSFTSLSATAAFSPAVSSPSTTEVLEAEAVDGAYFSTLGVSATIGRLLQPSDDERAAQVAVLSRSLWRLRFAADPAIVGQTIRIGGHAFEIVGVVSAGYPRVNSGPEGTRVWIPLAAEARLEASSPPSGVEPRERRRLRVFGRLTPTASVSAAAAEITAIARRLDTSFPRKPPAGSAQPMERSWTATSVAAINTENEGTRRFGLTVLALVSLVLVVACTNLANLMIARGTSRQRELAIRSALGASRWRLVREQSLESVLLALGGGAAAYVAFQLLQVWMSTDFQLGRWTLSVRPTLDPAALSVAAVALLLALAVFGLEPALHLARSANVTGAIAASTGRARTRRQRMVIRWQVAVSAGFFIVATMFVRQTITLARHDSGIDIDRIAVAVLNVKGPLWNGDRLRRAIERAMDEGRKDPAIEAVSASTGLPFGLPAGLQVFLSLPGEVADKQSYRPAAAIAATPSIFATLGIRMLHGRAFDNRDHAGAAPVVILSELTARRVFGTSDAVGQQLAVQRRSRTPQTATVIGIARDTDVRSILATRGPLIYLSLAQQEDPALIVVARSTTSADRALPALREALRRADPDLPVDVMGPGPGMISGPFAILRAGGMATLYLGGLTLLLSMIGLFGVQSHVIAHRTREIGVRMSLGATARQIKMMVLKDGYRPVLEGLTLGVWGGFAARVLARAYLELDVNVFDVSMLLVTPIPVTAAAFCACYLPARRAASVDPTTALRQE